MGKYKVYEKYKSSSLTWLGEIPEHWKTIRLQHLFKEQGGRSASGAEDLLSVSHYTGVTKRKERYSSGELITNAESLVGYKIVNPGDLVMNIMLAWNGSLGVSKYFGITSPAYAVFKPIHINEKYFDYLLRTKNAQQEFKKHSTGIIDSRLRLYPDKFIKIQCICPPKEEQTAIARFLDYKLAKINRFIRKKKQLIKLINEQKAAIINQAVTKGLDPNAKMKDSGIEWLGEIPEHWEVRKLKKVTSYFKGFPFKSSEYSDNGIPIVKVSNVRNQSIEGIDTFISKEKYYDEYNKAKLSSNDIIITTVGSKPEIINSAVGQIGFVSNEFDGALLNQNTVCLRLKSKFIVHKYLQLFLISRYIRVTFDSISLCIVNQAYLIVEKILDIPIVIPSIEEQQQIVSQIEKETAIINRTISTIEKEIALVEEYKTALIAEAVTGKIDVRGFEVPEEESEEESYEELEEEMSITAEDGEEYENQNEL